MNKKKLLHLVIFITGLLVISCSTIPTTLDHSEPPNSKIINPEVIHQEAIVDETTERETTNQEIIPPEPTNLGAINSIRTIINDMKLPHEGHPHGVPLFWDWTLQPRLGRGNNPGPFTAMTAWGQVYEDANGSPSKNTRIQIRDIRAYMLSYKDGKWHLLQKAQLVEGAAFREDFSDNYTKNADIRTENDGSISVKVGDGYNYHFWPSGRALINPNDIAGIFTTVQARLIIDDPDKPDDRLQARYLLDMGGDYWLNLDTKWDNFKTNRDIGIGRFRYVTTDWKAFNMHSLSTENILQYPPPIY